MSCQASHATAERPCEQSTLCMAGEGAHVRPQKHGHRVFHYGCQGWVDGNPLLSGRVCESERQRGAEDSLRTDGSSHTRSPLDARGGGSIDASATGVTRDLTRRRHSPPSQLFRQQKIGRTLAFKLGAIHATCRRTHCVSQCSSPKIAGGTPVYLPLTGSITGRQQTCSTSCMSSTGA